MRSTAASRRSSWSLPHLLRAWAVLLLALPGLSLTPFSAGSESLATASCAHDDFVRAAPPLPQPDAQPTDTRTAAAENEEEDAEEDGTHGHHATLVAAQIHATEDDARYPAQDPSTPAATLRERRLHNRGPPSV